MSSDAESKGDSAWRFRWWMAFSFIAGSLFGPLFGLSLPGLGPRPFAIEVKERRKHDEDGSRALRQGPAEVPPPPPPPLVPPAPPPPEVPRTSNF